MNDSPANPEVTEAVRTDYGSEGWGLSQATGSSPSGRATRNPCVSGGFGASGSRRRSAGRPLGAILGSHSPATFEELEALACERYVRLRHNAITARDCRICLERSARDRSGRWAIWAFGRWAAIRKPDSDTGKRLPSTPEIRCVSETVRPDSLVCLSGSGPESTSCQSTASARSTSITTLPTFWPVST